MERMDVNPTVFTLFVKEIGGGRNLLTIMCRKERKKGEHGFASGFPVWVMPD
jgi:hypothetical protein